MVKFLNLKKINERFEPQFIEAINIVLNSGNFLLGNSVRKFEEEYRQYIGVEHCICVGSGLDALRLILRSYIELGFMSIGDEIIVPANTYIASVLAITDNGLIPVFAEPDCKTFNIDPEKIERHINNRTRGIMIVHLYGQNAMHLSISELAERYSLKIIEDVAQAVGSQYNNQMVGSLGHAAGHSFYPGKNLGALGDGGAITTNDRRIADMVRALANYGSHVKYVNKYRGINSRLDEIQAAILSIKLNSLETDNQKRRKIADEYNCKIKNFQIILPYVIGDTDLINNKGHVWHLYVVKVEKRHKLIQFLESKQIQTLIHYPIPPHKQEAYSSFSELQLPITEKLSNVVLSLPISPVMETYEIDAVIKALNEFI